MTLGELITILESADPSRIAPIGFEHPHSHRGDYSELAFVPVKEPLVSEMLSEAREALGTTYTGWKGGEYLMDAGTECWLSEVGCSGESLGFALLAYMLDAPEIFWDNHTVR